GQKASKSSLRGFFNGRTHRNSSTRSVAAAMWMVVVLCAGMAASLLVIVGVLIKGIHIHSDQPSTAQTSPPSAPNSGPIAQAPVPQSTGAIAQLTREVRCQWVSRENAHRPGDQLAAGEQLELAAGVVELRFERGVKVVLQGPARAELTSAVAMRLQ